MAHCCDILEKIAEAKGSRIRYDSVYEEYNCAVVPRTEYLLFYCPFCGAKLPDSKRGSYFKAVSDTEQTRLTAMVEGCRKKEDLLIRIGQPDWKHGSGEKFDPIWKSKISMPAAWVYRQLSDSAELRVTFDNDTIQRVFVSPKCAPLPSPTERQTE